MTISMTSAADAGSDDLIRRFKQFLTLCPSIRCLVFSYTFRCHTTLNNHHEHVTRDGKCCDEDVEYRTDCFHAAIDQTGFFVRRIPIPDAYGKLTQRTFTAESLFMGKYGSTRYNVTDGLILEERPDGHGKRIILNPAQAQLEMLTACLAFGIWGYVPGSFVFLNETDFNFQSQPGYSPLPSRNARLVIESSKVAKLFPEMPSCFN